MKKKISSKSILLILSITFLTFFMAILTLSVISIVIIRQENEQNSNSSVFYFFKWLSNFELMKDPFSIFIQMLTSTGGVFFAIRIGQWIDEKKDQEQLDKLWIKIHMYLKNIQINIDDPQVFIRELSEYKIYWDSIQTADNIATQLLQEDEMYIEISYAFSFLYFYQEYWKQYEKVSEWKNNASRAELKMINNWERKIDALIKYANDKIICQN